MKKTYWFRSILLAALLVISGLSGLLTVSANPLYNAYCNVTSVGFPPLTDLGSGMFHKYQGGLYPGGANQPPAGYLSLGLSYVQMIQPRNSSGQPAATGQIVLLSVGMSNATQEFSEFKREAYLDSQKNPKLTIVDGAQNGQDAEIIKNPNANFWSVIDQRLTQAGVTVQQVQVAWLKEAIANEHEGFPTDAQHLQNDLEAILQIMRQRYPNLKVVYLASRTYAGYASTPLNPEPYAYNSGFAVKWLIEHHINADVPGPWVAWGPYLWTDGTKGRSDGFVWNCADVNQNDGTHPSYTSGVQKIAGLLLQFFKTNQTAVSWFL